jgi:hypothetical protein
VDQASLQHQTIAVEEYVADSRELEVLTGVVRDGRAARRSTFSVDNRLDNHHPSGRCLTIQLGRPLRTASMGRSTMAREA